ncbi:MAG: energy-coupling factor transporter transmembrane protein EcfT [Thermoleophilia bacterium]|nr:energy-coupling factor transporter transmembrane protein EcfT [Thermoleophilia bacterium]
MRLAPVPSAALCAGAAAAALLARHLAPVAVLAGVFLVVCLRADERRRRPYLIGALVSAAGVFLLSPLLAAEGVDVLWSGPRVPVLGVLDVTVEELGIAALNALRLASVALAFAAYALLVDHDRLIASARFFPRSALAVALATRLVPSLERDAAGLRDAVRGRGVPVVGLRGHARLLSPLVAGSLERASNLAEAMEARGFGRAGRTVAPSTPWTGGDRGALALAALLPVLGALWL